MQAMTIKQPGGLDNIEVVSRDTPQPGPGEVLVRIHACSLNYHDYVVASGGIPVADGRIPMTDGAGEVTALGEGVTEFCVGDNVMSAFFPNWQEGAPQRGKVSIVPGEDIDGFAAEYVAAPATSFTRQPAGYSHAQAATLPCAALTAWRALMVDAQIKPGDIVLTQGSGGVSVFAIQFARAAGATVISTSSSDAKLQRLKELGAHHLINYKTDPDWGKTAAKIAGSGVDAVVEVGGPETLSQSIKACGIGGHIALIGVLTGVAGNISTATFFYKQLTMTGVTVGSQAHQRDMIRAIEANGIEPAIDRGFPMAELADAFRYQKAGKHLGKIVLDIQ